ADPARHPRQAEDDQAAGGAEARRHLQRSYPRSGPERSLQGIWAELARGCSGALGDSAVQVLYSAGNVDLIRHRPAGGPFTTRPSLEGANLSRGIARIAPSASLKAEFLALYLRSRTTQTFWSVFQQGTTFNEIPIALVRILPVLVPPIEEQDRIVTFVHEQNC